ncbi:hypothetical protein B0T18DRAFT_17360 [Schizothecium vesticola]|uniref:Uncharacterized protein n=1 Tax=Schizothecium vesticola TaxID=314040 RepID=A0AA40KC98_9PEZI|nr:hypothetical protein B0T18DRAFT_17360 [Schizothecium vesticola]
MTAERGGGGLSRKGTYLLLHLAHFELVRAEFRVVDVFVARVAVLDHALHLAHQRAARRADRLAGRLEVLLALAHEARLDAAGRHELRRRRRHVVGRHDQLLGAVAVGQDAVGRLDERVGRRGDGLGGRDETLGPAVVLLVKGRLGGRAAPSLHNLLLRGRGRLDELRDGRRDGHGRIEDRVVHLELIGRVPVTRLVLELGEARRGGSDGVGRLAQFLVDNLAQVALVGKLAEAGSERLHELVEPLQVHLHLVVAVDDNVRLLDRVHAVQTEAQQASEELDCRLRRLARPIGEGVALPLVGSEARETLGVAAHVGNGAGKDIDIFDQLRMSAVRAVGDEVVERRRKLHGAGRCLLNLRQHKGWRGVLVAGLHGRVEFVNGVVNPGHACLQDRVDHLVDLVQLGKDDGIELSIQGLVGDALVVLELIQLDERLVHACFVDLELLLLVAEELLQVGAAVAELRLRLLQSPRLHAERLLQIRHLAIVLGEHGRELVALAALEVIGAVEGHAELPPQLLDLVLLRARETVLVVEGSVALPDHVGQFQVLGLDLALQLLATINGFLGRGRLELDRLELLEEIKVLVSELRVELGESLVLCPPRVDLLLEGADLVILTADLLPIVVLKRVQLALERLDTLIVLLEHQLVALVLRASVEVFLLQFGQPPLRLPLRLLSHQRVLLPLLLLHQAALLLLKVSLRLELRLMLRQNRLSLLGFQHPLLLLVLAVLAVKLVLPKLVHVIGFLGLGDGWRSGLPLYLLLGTRRQSRGREILV